MEIKRTHALILIFLIAVIFASFLVYYYGRQSQPRSPSPEVVSYEGHGMGYSYVVYVGVANKGADGWTKVTVSAFQFPYITNYSQKTYLKSGQSATLQFVFDFVPEHFNTYASAATEGGPPEISHDSITFVDLNCRSFDFNTTLSMTNPENVSFKIVFNDFVCGGKLGNGSKIYFAYANLTNVENRTTFGSPLQPINLVAISSKSRESYPGLEVTNANFEPMASRIVIVVFVIPEDQTPECVTMPRDNIHYDLGVKGR
jgi:hypothetical protein